MTDATTKRESFKRIEFWAVLSLFVFFLFFFITDGLSSNPATVFAPNRMKFNSEGVRFNYYYHYFVPQLFRNLFLFGVFLVMNYVIVPQLIAKRNIPANVFYTLMLIGFLTMVFGVTDTYKKAWMFASDQSKEAIFASIFLRALLYTCKLTLIFSFYTAVKYASLYILLQTDAIRQRYRFTTQNGLIAIMVWLFILFLLVAGEGEKGLAVVWGTFIPMGIALYWYALYSLIPRYIKGTRPFMKYVGSAALILLIGFIPFYLVVVSFVHSNDFAFELSLLNALFQLLLTVPLSWIIFKRSQKGNEEIYALRSQLGKSNASLDFLRSQINPHFLFNALNTIYGTALQEKAERSAEGIERLGGMMRFMLQENMQETISLSREVDYLNNYIGLQRLRTDPVPSIRIETAIDQAVYPVEIAPMLLIPFVENAFKHGISFREPSQIKITLEIKENTLYFDVYNSKHPRPDNDPEKDKSGIGLNNVRQRLQALYPERHELIIRETGKDFFIHLTIKLYKQSKHAGNSH
ncbi:MAG: sensor histidine kinase [Chitinophagaceae bacterium]|nr:MAG: sensor histidine kinase [Chitinophagaceae bacterium]